MSKNKISKKVALAEKLTAKTIEEAIEKLKSSDSSKKRKFTESVDLAINLGIDAKQSDQSVKGSILLPNGLGKKVDVVVFVTNEEQKKVALDNGAVFAGLEDLLAKIEDGFLGFDCCIATPESMPKISKIARKLGPRGLMPSPKNGTVTSDIAKAMNEAMKGKVNFKNDKAGTVHCSCGRINFETEKLSENIRSVLKAVKEAKPETSKGKFIKEVFLNSTMGPSVQIDLETI